MSQRDEVLAAVAEAWNDSGVHYAVVRGVSDQGTVGRDVDVAIAPESVAEAMAVATRAAAEKGFTLTMSRWSRWGLAQHVLIDEDCSTSLPLDLMCTTDVWRAKVVPLLDRDGLATLVRGDCSIGPIRATYAGWYLKSWVRPVLCGNAAPYATQVTQRIATRGIPELPRFSQRVADELAISSPAASLPTAREAQWKWSRRHPRLATAAVRSAIESRARRRRWNVAPVVELVSADPEATLAELLELAPSLERLFIDIRPVRDARYVGAWLRPCVSGWRRRPVSEFKTLVSVAKSSSHRHAVISAVKGSRLHKPQELSVPALVAVLCDTFPASEAASLVPAGGV